MNMKSMNIVSVNNMNISKYKYIFRYISLFLFTRTRIDGSNGIGWMDGGQVTYLISLGYKGPSEFRTPWINTRQHYVILLYELFLNKFGVY